ncbi:hypothetical protein AB0D90_14650 [Streptomyces althioticus]
MAATPYTPPPRHLTRHRMCDCGTCCDACGHYEGCMSRSPEVTGQPRDVD